MGASDNRSLGQRSILLVDDDAALCRAAARNLHSAGYEVRYVHDPDAALAACAKSPPDLLLVDLCIPGHDDGLSLMEQIAARYPAVPVIVFSAFAEPQYVFAATNRRARDFWRKPVGDLVDRAARFFANPDAEPVVDRQYRSAVATAEPDLPGELRRLTPKEREVAALAADGYEAKEIAAELGISVHTLKQHIKKIRRTIGIRSFRNPIFNPLRRRRG